VTEPIERIAEEDLHISTPSTTLTTPIESQQGSMKIDTTRQSLLDALLVVSRAVSARAALQALSGILISTNGEARLRATDMELGLEVGLGGDVDWSRWCAPFPTDR
jgi:hypothetical protein